MLQWLRNRENPVYHNHCGSDGDCPQGQQCTASEDYNGNICAPKNMVTCNLSPFTELQECDPSDTTSNYCGTHCINQPPFLCRAVSNGILAVDVPGTGYTAGMLLKPAGGTGSGMVVSVATVGPKGEILSATVSSPGNGYVAGDVLSLGLARLRVTASPNPFVWRQGDQMLTLPNSKPGKGWCLPAVKPTPCNNFTSDSILVETRLDEASDGEKFYEWECLCSNDDMFTKAGFGGDCILEKACGAPTGGKLLVSDYKKTCNAADGCPDGQRCCAPGDVEGECCTAGDSACANVKYTGQKYCFEDWEKQKALNPAGGRCDCAAGLTYTTTGSGSSDYRKLCVSDPCSAPGCVGCSSTSAGSCQCGPGFLVCHWDSKQSKNLGNTPDSYAETYCKDNPRCLVAPCGDPMQCTANIGEPGTLGTCVVKDPSGTWGLLPADNALGVTCVDYCSNGGIGYSCSGRGDCTVVRDGSSFPQQQCKNCTGDTGDKGNCMKTTYTQSLAPAPQYCLQELIKFGDYCDPNSGNSSCCSGVCGYEDDECYDQGGRVWDRVCHTSYTCK